MIDIAFEYNETVRLTYYEAEWVSDHHRRLDKLVLTEKGLYCVFQIKENFFSESQEMVYRFSLEDIVIEKGIAQMETCWIANDACLQIQFRHGMEYFLFSSDQDKHALATMIRTINEILGTQEKIPSEEGDITCHHCGKLLPARARYCFFCRSKVTENHRVPKDAVERAMAADQDLHRNKKKENPSYYLAMDGQAKGPFTKKKILEYAEAGKITRKTLCWTKGMKEWTPLEGVEDLQVIEDSIPPALS